MKVLHLSPTYFSPDSVVGGGERFAEELARAMSRLTDVKFVSFGSRPLREPRSPTHIRVILRNWTRSLMTPFSPLLLRELRDADVIHCHQYHVLPTFVAAWWGYRNGRKVFVSDLGGGGWTPAYQIDQSRWITAHLPISMYAARYLPGSNRRHAVIYGGVDIDRYRMRSKAEHDGSVVFLGRILPHKGVHLLIEGLPNGVLLHVIGTCGDKAYLLYLRQIASGKRVAFHVGLGDEAVVALLQGAMALVHPTPVDSTGDAREHELFGLALVEAMACGCPVIASRVASLPEIVDDGQSGLLIPPNEPGAIAAALVRLAADRVLWLRLSAGARSRVESDFAWHRVASRCLAAYSEFEEAPARRGGPHTAAEL